MSVSDLCGLDFPAPAEIARLAENARTGRSEPFVGRGVPDSVLACVHGQWRLGDVLEAAEADDGEAAGCTELTKAGTPCKGRPGDDGLCAAHKGAADAAGTDQAAAEGSTEGEENGEAETAGAPA